MHDAHPKREATWLDEISVKAGPTTFPSAALRDCDKMERLFAIRHGRDKIWTWMA
jgi:hypothetical protein